MKKIVLLLAAVAALASCVKENTFEQTQPADGLVTIKALAMDTKTTLGETTGEEGSRQTAVLWEATDKIMVVYENVDGDSNNDDIITEFEVSGTPEGSSATFKGQYNSTDFPAKANSRPIAVYPSSSVSKKDENGKFVIKHNLPEVQDGKDLSGLLLSTAVLKDEDLMAGTATATFNNALTLLKVVVPEGVKSVALTSNKGLVGDAQFSVYNTYSEEQVWDDDSEGFVTSLTEATGKLSGEGNKNTVTLSDGGAELDAKTYHVLIYPHNASTFTVTMTGMTDDVKYESTLTNLTFTAGEFRTLNLTKIFKMEGAADKEVSSIGETFTVSVAAAEEYEYTVTIEYDSNGDNWLSFDGPANVKALSGTKILFTAEANNSGMTRTAEITIKWNDGQEDKSKTFRVTQESAYLGFVYVDPTDTESDHILWEESFGVYASKDDYENYLLYLEYPENDDYADYASNLKRGYKNTFTIALTNGDETQYGTYKIEGMFKTDRYYTANPIPSAPDTQYPTNQGGIYYADYNSENNQLTVKMANATKSYQFSSDIVLTYDEVNKMFTAPELAFAANTNSYLYNRAGIIPDYTIAPYVENEPGAGGEGDSSLNAFVGTWSETYVNKPYSWSSETIYEGEFTVSVVDGKLYFENMFLYKVGSTAYTSNYYGTLSVDGTTITLEDVNPDSPHGYFGPLAYQSDSPIVLTVEGNTLKVASAYSGQVANYVATKK